MPCRRLDLGIIHAAALKVLDLTFHRLDHGTYEVINGHRGSLQVEGVRLYRELAEGPAALAVCDDRELVQHHFRGLRGPAYVAVHDTAALLEKGVLARGKQWCVWGDYPLVHQLADARVKDLVPIEQWV